MNGRLQRMAMITTPFPQDEAMSGPQASRSSIRRDGLVQNEVRPNRERIVHAGDAVGDGKDDRLVVGFAFSQLANEVAAALHVVAVNEDGVEFSALDRLASRVG